MSRDQVTYFGETDFRNERKRFGIKAVDRLRHVYIIGKTGVGKSTMLENMAVQDIVNNNGIGFFDPHGKTAELLLDYIPEHRMNDVVYFAPFDTQYPISFNILETVEADKRHFVANGILSVFKKIWADKFSDRMEYILGNTILALIEYPDATMLGINRMLTDKEYRKKVIDNITDPSVKAFWVDEYLTWDDRYAREAGASIQNKVGQFTSNPLIRNIVGQPRNTLDLRKLMDEGKILIANLSKGQLGDENSRLLGGLLNTKIYLEAMSRAELSETELATTPPFYLFVDEFQNFASESFADILSEARKYKLSLTMAHQYVQQMPDAVREAVFGNVGTMVTFRIGPEDAEYLERQFAPVFSAEDLSNLGAYQIYLSLMIDGIGSKPFSANTLRPIPKPEISYKQQVIESSRRQFGLPRADVEKAIEEWYVPVPSEKQLQHQEYLREKRIEVEAKGGVWKDPKTGKVLPPLPESLAERAKRELAKEDRAKGVEDKPRKDDSRQNVAVQDEKKSQANQQPEKKPEKSKESQEQRSSSQKSSSERRPLQKKEQSKSDDKAAKQGQSDSGSATFIPDADDVFEALVARAQKNESKDNIVVPEEKQQASNQKKDVKSEQPPKKSRDPQEFRPSRHTEQNNNKQLRKKTFSQEAVKDPREAKDEHKQALRSLLQKVKTEQVVEEPKEQPAPESKQAPIAPAPPTMPIQSGSEMDGPDPAPAPSQQVVTESVPVPQKQATEVVEAPVGELTSPKTPREVPEDILRSVLR